MASQDINASLLSSSRRLPPPRGLRAVRVASKCSMGGPVRGKRLLGLIAVVGLPVLLQMAFLAFGEGRGMAFKQFITWLDSVYLGKAIPLLTIFVGTAAFGDEWEAGTAPYFVGLPLPRWTLIIGRWLAVVGRSLPFVFGALGLLYVLCVMSFDGALSYHLGGFFRIALGLTLLIAAYSATFLLFGLALRHAIVTSMIFVVVTEWFLANLPFSLALISPGFHARNLISQWTGEMSLQTWSSGLGAEPVAGWTSVLMMVAWTVLFLFASVVVLHRKESTGKGGGAAEEGSAGA